jgi:hypothetical protein
MDALEKAYEISAQYTKADIKINMMPGKHFLIRNRTNKY